jgi:anaerobic ribonucleoside-triphosphate reductase
MSFIIGKERKVKTEIFSRVSGYYRPVQQYNAGKREEFSERVYLDITDFKDGLYA